MKKKELLRELIAMSKRMENSVSELPKNEREEGFRLATMIFARHIKTFALKNMKNGAGKSFTDLNDRLRTEMPFFNE